MSMLPDLLGAEGPLLSVEHRGKKYELRLITFGMMAEIEVKHFEEAKDRLKKMAALYSPAKMDEKADELYQRYDDGDFGFLSAAGQAWIKKPAGAALLLQLVLGVPEEELIPLLAAKGDEIKQKLDQIVKESLPTLKKAAPERVEGLDGVTPDGGPPEATFRQQSGSP